MGKEGIEGMLWGGMELDEKNGMEGLGWGRKKKKGERWKGWKGIEGMV